MKMCRSVLNNVSHDASMWQDFLGLVAKIVMVLGFHRTPLGADLGAIVSTILVTY